MPLENEPQVTQEDGVTVIALGREFKSIDEMVMDDLREYLLEVSVAADPPRILIDLSQTEFFGSSFIELLFRIWNRMNSQKGGKFGVCGMTPYCREVLEITHLDQLWGIYANRDQALADLKAE